MPNPLGAKVRLVLRQVAWLKGAYGAVRRASAGFRVWFLRVRALLKYREPKRIGPPRGRFSAYEEVKSGARAGLIFAEKQTVPALVPGSVRDICQLGQTGFQPWPVFWSLHPEARLVGPTLLLLDPQNRGCVEAGFGICFASDPALSYVFQPPETRLEGNWISLVSRWAQDPDYNYYHWLLDALTRLVLLETLPADFRIIVKPGMPAFAIESLEILGLKDRLRVTPESNLIVESFYFCAPTSMTGCSNPLGVEFLRRRLLPAAKTLAAETLPERFFISRKSKTRGMSNEEEVHRFFRERGWAILDMEGLSLRHQMALFSRAKAICGVHGAAFSNLLWCAPGCKVLELFSSTFLNGCYEGLAENVGCEHHFLVFPGNVQDQIQVDICRLAPIIDGW